jgi:uncharacterized membrane protein
MLHISSIALQADAAPLPAAAVAASSNAAMSSCTARFTHLCAAMNVTSTPIRASARISSRRSMRSEGGAPVVGGGGGGG